VLFVSIIFTPTIGKAADVCLWGNWLYIITGISVPNLLTDIILI